MHEVFAVLQHHEMAIMFHDVFLSFYVSFQYYVQTHKLCNALEKLLLVTSPSTAFGGVTGGDTSQNRSEQREIAALADKKGRDESEQRQRSRRLKRRISSSSSDGCNDPIIQMNVSVETPETKRLLANTGQAFPISAEALNAAAAAGNITSEQIRRLTPNPLMGDNRMLSVMAGDVPPVSMNMVDGSFQQSIRSKAHLYNLLELQEVLQMTHYVHSKVI